MEGVRLVQRKCTRLGVSGARREAISPFRRDGGKTPAATTRLDYRRAHGRQAPPVLHEVEGRPVLARAKGVGRAGDRLCTPGGKRAITIAVERAPAATFEA